MELVLTVLIFVLIGIMANLDNIIRELSKIRKCLEEKDE